MLSATFWDKLEDWAEKHSFPLYVFGLMLDVALCVLLILNLCFG